jgi:hypothetical protein
MASVSLRDQIISQIERLTIEQQRQVLDTITSMARPRGKSGDDIIRHARELNFPVDDLMEMQRIIEQDCENIEPDEWELPA